MFAIVAIGLALLSVYHWRMETELFLTHMRAHHQKRGDLGFLTGTVTGLLKLFPLAADILITMFIVSMFGLGGGILGAVVGLAMSNTVSFFINREVRKYTRPAEPKAAPRAHTRSPLNAVAAAWRAYEDWWWARFGRAVYEAQRRAERAS